MRRVKVLITVPWGARLGGAEQMLWTFLRHAGAAGVEPTVVFLEDGPLRAEIEELGIPTHLCEAPRLRTVHGTLRAMLEVARIVRRESPEVVLDWTTKSHVVGGLATLLAHRRCSNAWWQHGFASHAFLDRVAAWVPADAVFCSSRASADAQARLRPRRRTIVVHPIVGRPAAPLARVRDELALPEGGFVVGICGRLQPWKRQDLVVDAIGELVRAGRDVHGLVVGGTAHGLSPEYAAELRARVAAAGLTERIVFTGHVDDAAPYIRAMDVLVNASDCEPFGMVLVEAMALSVPVVAFAAGGPAEIVEPGVSGMLLEGSPGPALVAALEQLADSPSLRRRLARGGAARFEEVFSPEAGVRRLVEELVRLADGR